MRIQLHRKQTLFILGAFLSIAVLDTEAQIASWLVASGGNGHFYEVLSAPGGITWSNANWTATNQDGYLATITSIGENAFVFGLVAHDTSFWYREPQSGNWFGPWLGGVQPPGSSEPAGGWTWVTGEPFIYTNWSPYQPNNSDGNENRLQMGGGLTGPVGTWNDVNETNSTFAPSFIIEYGSNPYAASLSIHRQSQGMVNIQWLSRTNTSYSVEWKSDLPIGLWVTLTNLVGNGSFMSVSETTGEESRFYRVVANP